MKRVIILITIFCSIINACTSKTKEGSNLTVFNGTDSNIFVIDKFSFDSEGENKPIQIFDHGYESDSTAKQRKYLKPQYIPKHSQKTFFFPTKKYNENCQYGFLNLYIIKEENLRKSKKDIIRENLFRIIKIDLNSYNKDGSDNYIYYNRDEILFKNQ